MEADKSNPMPAVAWDRHIAEPVDFPAMLNARRLTWSTYEELAINY